MNAVNDDKYGMLERPDGLRKDPSGTVVLLVLAVLIAGGAAIGLRLWYDNLKGPEFSTVAEIEQRGKISDACFVQFPNSMSAYTKCIDDNSPSATSFPWVTTHIMLSTAIAFFLALVVGRLYLFMRRLEDQRK